jgi:hypothetical protein
MKTTKTYNIYEFKVPGQILEDLLPGEEILFRLKTFGLSKFEQKFKLINLMIIVFFVVIFFINSIIETNGRAINSALFILIFVFVFPSVILAMIFRIRGSMTESFFLIITNKRIIPHIKERRSSESIEFYESYDLDSLNFLTFKKKKRKDQSISEGTINLVLNKNITIKHVQNIDFILNLIESILWNYGNLDQKLKVINERERITLPHRFNVNEELWETIKSSKIKSKFYFGISLIALSLGVFGFILLLTGIVSINIKIIENGFIILISLLISFGSLSILNTFVPVNKLTQFKKNLASSKHITLTLEEARISIEDLESFEVYNFNNNININISEMINPSSNARENIGAIHIENQKYSTIHTIFGPIEYYAELAEIVYLNLLKWKANNGSLDKEQIIKNQDIINKELTGSDKEEKILDKKIGVFGPDLPLKSKILISFIIILTIWNGIFLIVNLIYFSNFNLDILIFLGVSLTSIYGILQKRSFGYILIIIAFTVLLIIYIILISEASIVIYGIFLIIAIFEYRSLKSGRKKKS